MTSMRIILLLFLSCLTQCKKRQSNSILEFNIPEQTILSIKKPVIHASSIIGNWSYSFPFCSKEIVIRENGTFTFHEHGCTGQTWSQGTWRGNNTSTFLNNSFDIYLTSFEKYDPEPAQAQVTSSITAGKHANQKIIYIFDSVAFKATDSLLKNDPSFPVYFNSLHLRMDHDTLYQLDSSGWKTDTKYALSY